MRITLLETFSGKMMPSEKCLLGLKKKVGNEADSHNANAADYW